jgi:hypothetical protein
MLHAVCCVILFHGKSTDKIPNNWVTDKVNDASNDDFLAFNSRAGRMLPGGPKCFVDGKWQVHSYPIQRYQPVEV